MVFLPTNSTRSIQPLDLTVNNSVKKKLREICVEKHDNWRVKLSRKEVANRIAEAWGSISAHAVKLGFSKAILCKPEINEVMEIEQEISYYRIRD